jgi:uncharacterized protein (TIGR03067 family)
MRTSMIVILLPVTCVLAADPVEESAKALKELEGTYTFVALEKQGEKSPDAVAKDVEKVVIEKNRLTIHFRKEAKSARLGADPTKNPKQIDMIADDGARKGQITPGIYKMEDGDLWLCFDEEGKSRPKEFKTEKKSKHFLWRLRRAKQ